MNSLYIFLMVYLYKSVHIEALRLEDELAGSGNLELSTKDRPESGFESLGGTMKAPVIKHEQFQSYDRRNSMEEEATDYLTKIAAVPRLVSPGTNDPYGNMTNFNNSEPEIDRFYEKRKMSQAPSDLNVYLPMNNSDFVSINYSQTTETLLNDSHSLYVHGKRRKPAPWQNIAFASKKIPPTFPNVSPTFEDVEKFSKFNIEHRNTITQKFNTHNKFTHPTFTNTINMVYHIQSSSDLYKLIPVRTHFPHSTISLQQKGNKVHTCKHYEKTFPAKKPFTYEMKSNLFELPRGQKQWNNSFEHYSTQRNFYNVSYMEKMSREPSEFYNITTRGSNRHVVPPASNKRVQNHESHPVLPNRFGAKHPKKGNNSQALSERQIVRPDDYKVMNNNLKVFGKRSTIFKISPQKSTAAQSDRHFKKNASIEKNNVFNFEPKLKHENISMKYMPNPKDFNDFVQFGLNKQPITGLIKELRNSSRMVNDRIQQSKAEYSILKSAILNQMNKQPGILGNKFDKHPMNDPIDMMIKKNPLSMERYNTSDANNVVSYVNVTNNLTEYRNPETHVSGVSNNMRYKDIFLNVDEKKRLNQLSPIKYNSKKMANSNVSKVLMQNMIKTNSFNDSNPDSLNIVIDINLNKSQPNEQSLNPIFKYTAKLLENLSNDSLTRDIDSSPPTVVMLRQTEAGNNLIDTVEACETIPRGSFTTAPQVTILASSNASTALTEKFIENFMILSMTNYMKTDINSQTSTSPYTIISDLGNISIATAIKPATQMFDITMKAGEFGQTVSTESTYTALYKNENVSTGQTDAVTVPGETGGSSSWASLASSVCLENSHCYEEDQEDFTMVNANLPSTIMFHTETITFRDESSECDGNQSKEPSNQPQGAPVQSQVISVQCQSSTATSDNVKKIRSKEMKGKVKNKIWLTNRENRSISNKLHTSAEKKDQIPKVVKVVGNEKYIGKVIRALNVGPLSELIVNLNIDDAVNVNGSIKCKYLNKD